MKPHVITYHENTSDIPITVLFQGSIGKFLILWNQKVETRKQEFDAPRPGALVILCCVEIEPTQFEILKVKYRMEEYV